MPLQKNPIPLNLVQGTKVNQNAQFVDALSVNMSGIIMPILGADGFMQMEPGLTLYAYGQGLDRGGVWNDNFKMLFRVSGNFLIQVFGNGTTAILGQSNIDLIARQAAMPYSFNTQAIVIDGKYYLYDPVNGARQVTDPDVGTPIDAVWVDGYYVFTDGDFLYCTELDDEEAINPIKYDTAQFQPDRTYGVGLTTDDKVMAWGRFSVEFFQNTASEGFPFTRIPSRTVQYGVTGTYLKCQIGGEWFFVGGPAEGEISVYKLGVGTAQNVSSRAVDAILKQFTSAEDGQNSNLESRVINNYPYLVLNLPTITLMLNLKMAAVVGFERAWCVLSSGTVPGANYRAVHGVFDPRRAQWTYGDKINANIGYLDFTVATHYEQLVEWVLYTPFQYLETASIDQLMIQTVPGIIPSPAPPLPPPAPPPIPPPPPPLFYVLLETDGKLLLESGGNFLLEDAP